MAGELRSTGSTTAQVYLNEDELALVAATAQARGVSVSALLRVLIAEAVPGVRREVAFSARSSPRGQARAAEALAAYLDGETAKDIARRFEVSEATIRARIQQARAADGSEGNCSAAFARYQRNAKIALATLRDRMTPMQVVICEAVLEASSLREVQDAFGVTKQAVSVHLRRVDKLLNPHAPPRRRRGSH